MARLRERRATYRRDPSADAMAGAGRSRADPPPPAPRTATGVASPLARLARAGARQVARGVRLGQPQMPRCIRAPTPPPLGSLFERPPRRGTRGQVASREAVRPPGPTSEDLCD